MDSDYDICIDSQTIGQIRDKLKIIGTEISEGTKDMANALQASEGFLAGQQYEKARSLTLQTIQTTSLVSVNVTNSIHFLDQLEEQLERYMKCKYTGA